MTAIRMPDLRAGHGSLRARTVRLRGLRVPDAIREATRADGVAASTTLAVVGAAMAWWLPGEGILRTLGLALVVLGPLGVLATLTLVPPTDVRELDGELAGTASAPPKPVDDADGAIDDVDRRLPELELQHSVRP